MKEKKKIHFIGIGGVGMSGLSEVFHCRGYSVQGSDIKRTKIIDRLEAAGIHVEISHSAGNINEVDYVVYSSCIREDNVELREARERRIPVLRRIEALNMLMGNKDIVAVSGAHGKTTTTSLVAYILIRGGLDPTVFIGADVDFLNGNARCGQGNMVVTEADESDGSFLLLSPLYSISTNVDMEHMDFYCNMDNVLKAYERFIENTRKDGCAFVCADDAYLEAIIKDTSKKVMRYGFSQAADVRAEEVELLGLNGSRFNLIFRDKLIGRVGLSIIGIHNILNSLAAIGLAMDLGIDFSIIRDAVSNFKGADRRFIVSRLDSDIIVIDDYAHHPTEIIATLKALEDSGKRIVAVFQPHRYSRTGYLREQFGKCFRQADHVIITDIYPAHEKPIDGVTAQDLCEGIRKCGHQNVHFVAKEDVIGYLKDIVKPRDAVFILGAGDIGELSEKIIDALGGLYSEV